MGKVKDMTGQRFGKLTVLSRDDNAPTGHGAYWICLCDCGNTKSIRGDALRTGKTKSCGMTNRCSERNGRPIIDMTGKRFGKLLVIKQVDKSLKNNNNKEALWECKCDCGNTTYIPGYSLRTGVTKSCGCLRHEKEFEDLTGKKFGSLTVIKRDYVYGDTKWLCRCDCGKFSSVKASSLKNGSIKSCGCKPRKYKDLTGKKFGMLTVIEVDKEKTANTTGIVWKCKCDCGNTTSVQASHLTSHSIYSCGCAKISYGEFIIRSGLDKQQIKYYTEYTFNDLRSELGGILRFDFYLPDYNMCIEYDGEQHFKPIDCFGGQNSFNRIKNNDGLKNQYCKTNHIKLLRIPYTIPKNEILKIINNNIQESRNDHSLGSNDQTYADNLLPLVS